MEKKLKSIWRYIRRTEKTIKITSKYVDLAPTSKADEAGIYFEALDYATNNPDISNIALTGPYGSGKSSVIKSFLIKYTRPTLQISLASFLPEADGTSGKVSKQEIERSILQQMLYGADANNLPLSRFKRIQSPTRLSPVISLFIVLGCLSVWHLFQQRAEIVSGGFFTPFAFTNWFNLTCFVLGFAFLWRALHHVYVKSFGLSLKSISLKDVEIAPETADEESILNRHLDEIIYFFQSTQYDLVIIEDLDRFDNPDIFVTLREINGLINANAGVKRKIRFLYALRDDMFINTDRTKFFEFIVPVIPIINHSNSIDKLLEQGQRLSPEKQFDRRFLREVSRYLNDLRLIRNIFNEYAIYVAKLEVDGESNLDPNKLLAVMIYKNVLPRDFEELHQQKGVLAEILGRYDEYVSKIETDQRSQLSKIEVENAEAEKQLPKDLSELRKIYAMALIERIPSGHAFLRFGSSAIPLSQLPKHNDLEKIISSSSLASSVQQNSSTKQVSMDNFEAEIGSQKTFLDRKDEIERKSATHKEASAFKIHQIKTKIASLRTRELNEVIRTNVAQTEDCFAKLGENRELLKFLIFEGFLDDTYYQYTSLFHSGRLSPNDNKFLIQIRSYNNPEPDFQIDNATEVVAEMREEDFSQGYVLNRHLMDFIFDDPAKHKSRISKAMGFIAFNFERCDAFFLSYYERGTHVQAFISALVEHWPAFASVALESLHGVSHAARIIAFAPEKLLTESPHVDSDVAGYFSSNAEDILNESVEFDLSRLKLLQVEVVNLPTIAAFSDVVKFVSEEALYRISIENIQFVLEHVLGSPDLNDLESKHFTTVLKTENKALITCIKHNFSQYAQRVLLRLEHNTEEEISAIHSALAHDEVATKYLKEFLVKQSAIFPSFENIPHRFRPALLQQQKILISWENCLAFLSSESYNAELLTSYLQKAEPLKTLSSCAIPDGKEAYKLRKFLIENDDFVRDTYRLYAQTLPKPFKTFPSELSSEKLKILIEERKVVFSEQNFVFLEEHENLQVLSVSLNFDAYLRDQDSYQLDDDFRTELLKTTITDGQKFDIIRAIDPTSVLTDASLASTIGSILNRLEIESDVFSPEFIQAIIVDSRPIGVQISLFNMFHTALSIEEVRRVIEDMPTPFAEIAIFGNSPKIDNTHPNRTFVAWLKGRRVISSSKLTFAERYIRIHTFKNDYI